MISGAQTGVDRGALDAALAAGLACGGTVPKGRRAEDGPVPPLYPVVEHASTDYAARTEQNVLDAEATLILTVGTPKGGTKLTIDLAKRHGRPHLVVRLDQPGAEEFVRAFLAERRPAVLNVAGPRESSAPGIQERVRALLEPIFKNSDGDAGGNRGGNGAAGT